MNTRIKWMISTLVLICLAWSAGEVQAESLAILMSDSLTSTTRTLQGARKVIRRSNPDLELQSFFIGKSPADDAETIKAVQDLHPRAILTIGSAATSLAKKNFGNTPIIFAGVMYPVLSGFVDSNQEPGGNITGASLDIPTDIQFRYFRMIIPDIKRIGVLYTENTASLIDKAKRVAAGMDIDLVAVKVASSKQLPQALDSLAGAVDGVWSVADPDLFDPQATRYILLNTLRKGVPFMGFSRYVVESGALFALDFDYKAVGIQAGQITNKILSGTPPGQISVSAADVIWFHYNEKTAHHINVEIPEELVAVAKEVYR